MTSEEAIKELRDASDSEVRYGDKDNHYDKVMKRVEAFEMAIKALEQQPCVDCISRKELLNALEEPMNWTDSEAEIQEQRDYDSFVALIKSMPSVTPKLEYSWKEIKIKFECDDCISRQAVLDLTGKSDWFESSDDYNDFVCAVCNLPSVKPTRPKGVWLKRDYWSEGVGMGETYGYYYQCSECKKMVKGGYISCDDKFCSKCGAEMRGSEE